MKWCRISEILTGDFFKFSPYLGKIPILTHIFQTGWFNHQLENNILPKNGWLFPSSESPFAEVDFLGFDVTLSPRIMVQWKSTP